MRRLLLRTWAGRHGTVIHAVCVDDCFQMGPVSHKRGWAPSPVLAAALEQNRTLDAEYTWLPRGSALNGNAPRVSFLAHLSRFCICYTCYT